MLFSPLHSSKLSRLPELWIFDIFWIDALCILQDSQLDWEEESTKIGAIYGNSFVTIAADWSSGVDGGLYNEVSENILGGNDELVQITSMLPNGRESSLYLEYTYRNDIPEIKNSKLTNRA